MALTASAAYAAIISIAPDSVGSPNTPGAYAALGGQEKSAATWKSTNIDISQLNNAGYVQKLMGLQDADATIDYLWISSVTAQASILTALQSNVSPTNRIWLKVGLDGSHYLQFSMLIAQLDLVLDVKAASMATVKFELDGSCQPTTNPISG